MRQHFYIHTAYSYYLNIGGSTKRQQAASDSHRANGATAKGAGSLKGALLRKEHEKFRTVGLDSNIILACQKACLRAIGHRQAELLGKTGAAHLLGLRPSHLITTVSAWPS
jgi:hypothetical protein